MTKLTRLIRLATEPEAPFRPIPWDEMRELAAGPEPVSYRGERIEFDQPSTMVLDVAAGVKPRIDVLETPSEPDAEDGVYIARPSP